MTGYVVIGVNRNGGFWGKGETLDEAEREAVSHAFGTPKEKRVGERYRFSTDDLDSVRFDGLYLNAVGLTEISSS